MPYAYNPLKSPAENLRLTLADQVASGATAASYVGSEPPEATLARVVVNNAQLAQSGAGLDTGTVGLEVLASQTEDQARAASGAAAAGAEGINYIVTDPSGTPTENAANLVAATTAAALLAPNGSALSATNRAVVIINAGHYKFTSTAWTVANPYIDFVGIGNPLIEREFADNAVLSTGCLVRSADYVRFYGIHFKSNAALDSFEPDAQATYYPTVSGANCEFNGCRFETTNSITSDSTGARFDWSYDETWVDCTIFGNVMLFGGSPGNNVGTITAKVKGVVSNAVFLCAYNTFNGTMENSVVPTEGLILGAASRVFYSRNTGEAWPTPTSGGKVRMCLNPDFTAANLG
jgi:hypothetical protein